MDATGSTTSYANADTTIMEKSMPVSDPDVNAWNHVQNSWHVDLLIGGCSLEVTTKNRVQESAKGSLPPSGSCTINVNTDPIAAAYIDSDCRTEWLVNFNFARRAGIRSDTIALN